MQRVYQAANSIEAHMIVHLLQQAGVNAHVEGEHLQSGAGELPLGNLVAVVVADDDVTTAREIIREWESRSAPTETTSREPAKSGALGQGVAFLIGAALAGGIVWSIHNGPTTTEQEDRNGDGKPEEWRIEPYGDDGTIYRQSFVHGVTSRIEYLNSVTGKVRKRVDFVNGKAERAYVDLDEDGTWDRTYRLDAIDEPVYEE